MLRQHASSTIGSSSISSFFGLSNGEYRKPRNVSSCQVCSPGFCSFFFLAFLFSGFYLFKARIAIGVTRIFVWGGPGFCGGWRANKWFLEIFVFVDLEWGVWWFGSLRFECLMVWALDKFGIWGCRELVAGFNLVVSGFRKLVIGGFSNLGIWAYSNLVIWGYNNLGIWGYSNLVIWGFSNLEIWGLKQFGDIRIWQFGNIRI